MAEPLRIPSDLQVQGNIVWTGTHPPIDRANFTQENLKRFSLNPSLWRVWDAIGTALGSPAADDLGITAGVFGTGTPYLTAGDNKANGAVTTRYARQMFTLPTSYVAGETVQFAFAAGMLTTIADVSATVDVEIFKSLRTTLITGSDLVTTAAQSINSLTFAELTFTVTPTSLSPGDTLDIRIAIACRDNATGTAVTPAIAAAELLLDIKG